MYTPDSFYFAHTTHSQHICYRKIVLLHCNFTRKADHEHQTTNHPPPQKKINKKTTKRQQVAQFSRCT